MRYGLHLAKRDSGASFPDTLWEILNAFWKSDQPIVIVDAGFYKGAFTDAALAGLSRRNHRVYSFEANPRNYELNSKRFQDFATVEILNKAVGREPGKLPLKMHKTSIAGDGTSYGGRLLMPEEKQSNRTEDDFETIMVDTIALSDFFEERGINPTLVKLDIQGAELHGLKGMRAYLRKTPIVYCEAQLLNCIDKPTIQLLERNGFIVYFETFQLGLNEQAIGSLSKVEFLRDWGLEVISDHGSNCIFARLIEKNPIFNNYGVDCADARKYFTYLQTDLFSLNIEEYPVLEELDCMKDL